MRSGRIWWLFVTLVEAILLLGAFLVALLPGPVLPFGWAVSIVFDVVVAVVGIVLISRSHASDRRRYVWSKIG